jgi:hypothetical protein
VPRLVRLVLVALFVLVSSLASAHSERPIASPIRPGPVPDLNRKNSKSIVVCKASSKPTRPQHKAIIQRIKHPSSPEDLAQARLDETAWHRNSKLFKRCAYEHIQQALNAATDDTDVFVMPGLYREEPSRAQPTSSHGDNPDGTYSYEWHVAHPNDANLIFLSKNNITIEGTGSHMTDVEIDGGFAKDVGIRCDRCTGIIMRNFWLRDVIEHGVYVVDSDGYIFDHLKGSMCGEYSLFSFASDHGLYTDCDAESGGDSALYIGGDPDTSSLGRYAAELRNTKMHHAALGFSGTQGSSVWMHDNDFYDNAIGISFDSENDHPNFPQRKSLIENNLIHDNNFDVYAPTSDVPARGPAYDFFRYPVGTGMWMIGGQDNVIRNNQVWNNHTFGFLLAGNPLEAPLPAQVHRNQFVGNIMGTDPDGAPAPNGTGFLPGGPYAPGGSDFIWDGTGNDNCWGLQDPASGPIVTDPDPIPGPCPAPNTGNVIPAGNKLFLLLSCQLVPDPMNPGQYVTADLIFPCPFGHANLGPYQNADRQQCGNSVLDRGEDCDTGYGGGGSGDCADLGLGAGTYTCTSICTYDTTNCAAPTCGHAGASKIALRSLGTPAGNEQASVFVSGLDTAGRTFDPVTEDVSIVLRNDAGLLVNYTIPAGSPWVVQGRRATLVDSTAPITATTRLIDTDGDGTYDAIQSTMSGATIPGPASSTVAAVVRVGDDCWRSEMPCAASGSGHTNLCRKAARP